MFKKLLALIVISLGMFTSAMAFNVTFKVDMNGSGLSNVSLNGTFNNWCGVCAPMSDANADGIWEITIPLAAGTYEYKFTAGSGATWETLAPGSSCTVTNFGFTNRSLVVAADATLPTVCFGSCVACNQAPPSYPVTFKVDMTNVTGFTTPTVNGSFDGWCGNCHPMTDANADGIWETTLNLQAGNYEYKFAYNNWAGQENLTPGSSCTMTTGAYTNRTIAVSAATTLPVVCWGSCAACNVLPPSYTVTFQLDMQNVTGFTTPEVNGTFNGWCGNCNAMSDVNGDNIWETTITIPAGNYEYKFSYDTWTGQENLTPGSSCTMTTGANTNRTLSLTANTTLPVVCWASCAACVTETPGCTDPTAANFDPTATVDDGHCLFTTNFNVDMNCTDPFTNVYITGPWCGWCGADVYNILTDANSDGIYNVSVDLSAGNVEYKYMVDNWASQENLVDDVQNGGTCAPVTDGATYANRQIVVGTTTNDVYGKCSACDGVVANPCDILTLPFDNSGSLTNWSTVADATLPEASMTWDASGALRLSGSNTATAIGKAYIFQYLNNTVNYNGNTTVQLDFDVKSVGPLVGTALHLQTEFPGTGVTNTFDIQNGGLNENTWTHYTYSFNNVAAASNFRMHFNMAAGAFLGAGGTLLVDNIELNCYTPTVISGCTDPTALNYNGAATQDDGSCTYPVTYNVTFQVDMQNVTGFTTPEVNGTFNNWCGGCAPMTDANGDNIWELTIPLSGGSYEFKYAHDAWLGQEALTEGSACTTTNFGYTNRTLNVNADVTLPVVCWASCTSCAQTPVTYNVTFQVDMQNVTGFTTPEVNGTFNNWCGGCFTMTDVNGDNIWEATTQLAAGTYEFKYAYDAWAGSEQLNPGDACTITNGAFTNRALTISSDLVLPVVCWASCADCGSTATPVDVTFQVDMQYSLGLGFTTPEVNGTFNNWCGGCAPMSDADGNNIWEITISLVPGTYEYKFAYDTWAGQEAMVDGSTCTITTNGFTNRVITVIDAETLPAVCWESCELCPDFVNETSNTISVYPNPSNGNIRINSNLALPYNVEVFDLSGRKVQDMKVFQNNTDINLENLAKGAYQIRVSNNYNSVRETVIIK
jgi:1,4-alpha-glucan branching enzyme